MHNAAYAPEAFGFVNVIFFTPGDADVSPARLARLRRPGDDSKRFTASRRRLLPRDLSEACESRAATDSEKVAQQSRLTRASAQVRRIMICACATICCLPVHFILSVHLNTEQWNDRATPNTAFLATARD